ncbi:fumarylacetoacetate hydrolase family protein [Motilimonas sp. 1_MG-2023]|uniref:fumarylacetoacetate hydrolase family protein n=1 Tax=Motilimonas sp. 1_MG-2023 TaxID=3062672 RepID=UPI0026E2861F|nr:fumarylacetoacetate hydrolase family protein [Motilimonas sp. 1_MG-2023]MDO6527388.1 fumarylacetoacetate hydrolase family protein [Motilimonas sp. 1_MG-2023]
MNGVLVDGETVYPSKVVCIGRNYVAHIQELGNETPEQPVIFVKPNSAIAKVLCTCAHDEVHYEAEMTFVVQSGQLNAVGFGLDLTKRALQSALKAKGLPWERAKAFDKSAVFSQFVPFKGDVSELRMELYINEQLIQLATYDLMIHKPADIVAEVSSFMTLNDSDLLMTGTPKGVGKLNVGDQFVGKIFQQKTLLVEHSWQVT